MKRFTKILTFALIALTLAGCSEKKSEKGSIRSGRTARGYSDVANLGQRALPGTGQTSSSGRVWGAIYGGNTLSAQDFDWNVHDFVAAFMDSANLGTVSSGYNDSTGIRFYGYAQTNGTFNPNGNNNATISAANSELRLVIWDSYAGYLDNTGELITEVPVHIRGSASGEVYGNRARVRFSDGYGWIELYGTFNNQYFEGTVWFDNTNGYANYLGSFFVPTCSFFRCY